VNVVCVVYARVVPRSYFNKTC